MIYFLALVLLIATGCQKELSFEGPNTPAKGTLQSDLTGDCLPKTVNGTYIAGTPLVPATNTITIQVDVTQPGTYTITTDTTNGYFFRGTGIFTTSGLNTVTLRSSGTPFQEGIDNFIVSFNGTVCDIQVTVLPAGSGPATFTLVSGGTPVNCATAVVTGTYIKDGALIPANNYVDITVNVTIIGTYTLSATGGGMTFSKTGTFTATGNQSVRLDGSGTPTTAGDNTIVFAAPFASCSFTVTVVASAVFTIDCPNVVVNGNYQVGTPLGASNTIDIPITVTTAGPYSIVASINGMTFSGSGTLTLSSTSITLTGNTSTSPTNSGTFNLLVGTPSCSIPITCSAAAVINWQFNIGTTVYKGSTFYDTLYSPSAPFTIFEYEGDNAALDDIIFNFIDLTGGITNTEQYFATSTGTINACDFYFTDGLGNLDLFSGPGAPPTGTMVFTVTSHNTATKTITGTFQGTAFDSVSGTMKTISGGTFTAVYP